MESCMGGPESDHITKTNWNIIRDIITDDRESVSGVYTVIDANVNIGSLT